jgi:hypothetical protein
LFWIVIGMVIKFLIASLTSSRCERMIGKNVVSADFLFMCGGVYQ